MSWLSDNEGSFISEFLETINKLAGTRHRHGSSLHPQTQGAVEITNAELDQKLRFYVDKYQSKWSVYRPALNLVPPPYGSDDGTQKESFGDSRPD